MIIVFLVGNDEQPSLLVITKEMLYVPGLP